MEDNNFAGVRPECDPCHWVHHIRGGEPLGVSICSLCGAIDWEGLRSDFNRAVNALAASKTEAATGACWDPTKELFRNKDGYADLRPRYGLATVEAVERELGVAGKRRGGTRLWSSTCSYNPALDDDPVQDCSLPAVLHVKVRGEAQEFYMLAACETHMQRVLGGPYSDTVLERHDFGSCCGVKDSWWVAGNPDKASFCVTEELGLEMGLLKME